MATRKSKIHAENRSSKQRSAAAREGHVRAAELPDDILVARQPLVGMLQQDIEQLLGATLTPEPGGMPPLTLEGAQRPQHWATRGMRHFLNEPEDSGYWDFFKISDGFLLSITDAQYRKDTWVRVEGTAFFKLRLLLTGSLRAASGEIIAQAPEALLYISPGVGRGGYYILALRARQEPLGTKISTTKEDAITTDSMLPLARLLLPLGVGTTKEMVDSASKLAANIRTGFNGCDGLSKVPEELKGAVYMNLGNMRVGDLSPEIQKALTNTHSGEMAQPFISTAGVEMIARCDKKIVIQTAYVMPTRQDVENMLFDQQISAMARRYMRDLRRGVDVEVR